MFHTRRNWTNTRRKELSTWREHSNFKKVYDICLFYIIFDYYTQINQIWYDMIWYDMKWNEIGPSVTSLLFSYAVLSYGMWLRRMPCVVRLQQPCLLALLTASHVRIPLITYLSPLAGMLYIWHDIYGCLLFWAIN